MKRRLVRLLTAPLTLLAWCGLTALPAHAASPAYSSTTRYVALGDSYSAGVGASASITPCGRDPLGYPTLWAKAHGITSFTDVTCGGAVTDDVLANQISALSPQTDVVTITIGGNDVGVGAQVLTCVVFGDQACAQSVRKTEADLPIYAAKIDKTYAAIRQAAPHADVYVLGYPHLFEPSLLCLELGAPSLGQRLVLNEGADVLDNALAQSAAKAGFHFVDVRQSFAGHSDCSLSAWINPLLGGGAALHPNASGYRLGYLPPLTAATG
jgi:lysophospholipase L1-like esterase